MKFNFFKKSSEGVPDVGKEETPVKPLAEEDEKAEEAANQETSQKEQTKEDKTKVESTSSIAQSLAFERLNAKLDALDGLIKGMNERFSVVNQTLGELRVMNVNNEKLITKYSVESSKAVDIVNEVQPDKLRVDLQRLDLKIQQTNEKLDSNKQFAETVMNELKDLRRNVNTFMNTEELLKFNDDVRKDLMFTQQLVSKSKLYSDKTEQLFVEVKKWAAESQKLSERIKNLDSIYEGMQKENSKLKIDFSSVANQNDLNKLKREIETKIAVYTNTVDELDRIKDEHDRLEKLIERIVAVEQQNKRDIDKISLSSGIEPVDYDRKIDSILHLLDALAGEITRIKIKLGQSHDKIKLSAEQEKEIDKGEMNLKNINSLLK